MQAALYPGATREFKAVHNDMQYLGIFFEYEYADNLKGESGFIVRLRHDPATRTIAVDEIQQEFFK